MLLRQFGSFLVNSLQLDRKNRLQSAVPALTDTPCFPYYSRGFAGRGFLWPDSQLPISHHEGESYVSY